MSAPSRTRAPPTTRPTRASLPLASLPLACGLRLASPRGQACTGPARLPSSPPTAMSSRPRPAPPPRPQANGCGPRLLEDGRRRLGAYNCRGARAAEGAEVGLWAYPASRLRRGRDTAGAGDRFRTEPQTQCRTSNTPSKTVSQQYVTRVLERDRHPLNRTRTTRYEAWTYFYER